MKIATLGFGLCLLLTATEASASRRSDIASDLRSFRSDSPRFMRMLPRKWKKNGHTISTQWSLFSKRDTRTREYVLSKQTFSPTQQKLDVKDTDPGSRAEIGVGDRPEQLVDRFQYDTLESIAQAGLHTAELTVQPWSGDYWAMYSGGIARRYGDSRFPSSFDWKENANYLLGHLGVFEPTSSSLEALSPAEKYDLLLGDRDYGLSRQMIDQGSDYYSSSGRVETWMGLCHGWAPASFEVARPRRKIDVLSADGSTLIPFFPSDIKALATALWANTRVNSRMIGSRCNVREPKADPVSGRITEAACFDDNPASWHLSIINQIGHSKRSFVMDATFDYQVWNQPVVSYEYTLFNPETQEQTNDPSVATIRMSEYKSDPFRTWRSPKAVAVAGVAMDVVYISETSPTQRESDTEEFDKQTTVRYLYDLELDAQGKIIGGEWYTHAHPDFLWLPLAGAQAMTAEDRWLELNHPFDRWEGSGPIPQSWKDASQRAARVGSPLSKVLKALVQMSQSNK